MLPQAHADARAAITSCLRAAPDAEQPRRLEPAGSASLRGNSQRSTRGLTQIQSVESLFVTSKVVETFFFQGPASDIAGALSRPLLSGASTNTGQRSLPCDISIMGEIVTTKWLSALLGIQPKDCTPDALFATGGMRGFLGQAPGFCGRIKVHPEDFCVNEITLAGEVITVTDKDAEDGSLEFLIPEPSPSQAASSKSAPLSQDVANPGGDGAVRSVLDPGLKKLFHKAACGRGTAAQSGGTTQGRDMHLKSTAGEVKASRECEAELADLLPQETVRELEAWASSEEARGGAGLNLEGEGAASYTKTFTLPGGDSAADKEGRAAVHRALKVRWPWCESRTVPEGTTDSARGLRVKVHVRRDAAWATIARLLSAADLAALQRFAVMSRTSADEHAGGAYVRIAEGANRAARTALHQALARTLPFFSASTERRANKECLCVSRRLPRGGKRARPGQLEESAGQARGQGTGESWWAVFSLRKRGMEHFEALGQLARALGVGQAALSYAGTKDKVGVTCQLVAARGVRPSQLHAARVALRGGLALGRARPAARPTALALGELAGNAFVVRVRGVSSAGGRTGVALALAEVARTGFVNYYGEQRVGRAGSEGGARNDRAPGVGAALVRGDLRGALCALLHSQVKPPSLHAPARDLCRRAGSPPS